MRKALAVARKEFRQIVRDRRTLMILLFIPVFFLLLFGYALSFDIKHIALAVQDRDNTTESRAVVAAFLNSGYFDYAGPIHTPADLERMMDTNSARAALVIPEQTARSLRRGDVAPVQVIINGDNANTAATVLGYATTIIRTVSANLLVEARGRATVPPISVEPRIWYNPELRSALFLVPGLIAFIGDDRLGDLDRAVGRAREGAGHMGAGADGAHQYRLVRRRQDAALSPAGDRDVDGDRRRGDGALRPADARRVGFAAARHLAVPARGARDGPPGLDGGRFAAGRLPDHADPRVPADVPALGLRVSHRRTCRSRSRWSRMPCRRGTS